MSRRFLIGVMKTLLSVDDGEDDVFFMRKAVQQSGIDCMLEVANTGDQAMEYLSGAGLYKDRYAYPLPEVILLDIKMPGRDGFEVLGWIRKQSQLKTIPVVMLTNSEEPKDIERAYREGANSYLLKPHDFEEFQKELPILMKYWLEMNNTVAS
ncbi:MAG: response regulator receiver protein [Pedosphaera sp.]|nr:response regulator receiver protein [Pedosphaera sp.]